jgi:phosphate-selective porin
MRSAHIAAGLGALALSGSAAATTDPDNPLPNQDAQQEAKPEVKKDGTDLRVYWKDGFRMETPDKSFSLRVSGRFQNDWAWFDADEGKYSAASSTARSTTRSSSRCRSRPTPSPMPTSA